MEKIISKENIVEIGIARVRNKCAWCNKEMDIKNYNIQLCKLCREEHLDKIIQKDNKGDGMNLREYILTKNDAMIEQ